MFSKTVPSKTIPDKSPAKSSVITASSSSSSSSPSRTNNSRRHRFINTYIATTITRTIVQVGSCILGRTLFVLCSCLLMNTFYHVMGAVRCPKIKRHPGIKLRPINKAKEPFSPNDVILFTCESNEYTQTIKCLEDGRWGDIPYCPDPTNFVCPIIGQIPHGYHNASDKEHKVGTVIAFRCENELLPGMINPYMPILTTTTTTTTTSIPSNLDNITNTLANYTMNTTSESNQPEPLRYNLTGHRLLRCLPSSRWNHPVPSCTPILPEPASNISFVLTSTLLILIPILILAIIIQLFIRWRKRQQQRARWKQYFTDYKYRHSKTSITFGMRPQNLTNTAANNIPVTDL